MTEQEKDQLLNDLLADEALDQLRQTSLSRGLQEMRGRRRRALATRALVMIMPALLLAVLIFSSRWQTSHQPMGPSAPASSSKVEYITTDQLYALFPNRPMALLGKPGHRQVIFLDEHSAVSESQ